MGFDWQGYYEFAKWLSGQACSACSDEVLIRNTISRAYYSALHALHEFYYEVLHRYPKRQEDETTHKALIEQIKINFVSYFSGSDDVKEDLKEVTEILQDFRDMRNEADYVPSLSLERPMDENTRDEAFVYASRIIGGIEAFRQKYI